MTSLAVTISASVVCRPSPMRIEARACASCRPMASRLGDGSMTAEAQADPAETADELRRLFAAFQI